MSGQPTEADIAAVVARAWYEWAGWGWEDIEPEDQPAAIEAGTYVAAALRPLLTDTADARAAGAREVIAAIEATYPPYNYELRYDGTEDPISAAYVEAFREVDNALHPFRAALAADTATDTERPLWRCDHWMHDVERCTPTKHYGRA